MAASGTRSLMWKKHGAPFKRPINHPVSPACSGGEMTTTRSTRVKRLPRNAESANEQSNRMRWRALRGCCGIYSQVRLHGHAIDGFAHAIATLVSVPHFPLRSTRKSRGDEHVVTYVLKMLRQVGRVRADGSRFGRVIQTD